jgi:hypothetical protein
MSARNVCRTCFGVLLAVVLGAVTAACGSSTSEKNVEKATQAPQAPAQSKGTAATVAPHAPAVAAAQPVMPQVAAVATAEPKPLALVGKFSLIPAAGTPGTHMVTMLHGDFTFPYLNMQQSPEPDRPQFHIPFRVTDGPAVLPPDISTQVLPVRGTGQPPVGGVALWTDQPAGIVGARTAVKARGLPANTEVEITWSTVVGNRVSGSGWEEQVRTLAKVKTDAGGKPDWTLAIPDDLGGLHTLGAKLGDRVLATGAFTIQPSAQKLSVERGPAGTEVMIQLNGVGWTETANIYHVVYDNAYVGYACGFNSGGNVQIFTRAAGAPGWHFIELYPGIYKGKETRPLNFRVPQLTAAADHPGERLPAFRFAFYVTGE